MIGQFPWDPFPQNVPLPKGPDPIHAHAFQSAVTSADAYRGVREALRVEHDLLRIGNRFVGLRRYREIAFVALGVAAGSMALAADRVLGDYLTAGFVAGPLPALGEVPFQRIEIALGAPIAPRAEEVVRSTLEIAETLSDDQLLLLLLSPGALSALALPPAGMSAEEFSDLLSRARSQGANAREVERIARVLGGGGVGGALGAAVGSADVATLLVDRGDGARLAGGGPVHPVLVGERTEVRSLLARLGLLNVLPASARERLAPDPSSASMDAAPVHRPVYVSQPSDALVGAGDALFDRKWRVRLGMLELRGSPEDAAEQFITRVEEVLAREPPPAADKSQGIAVPAMTTLDQPEGEDDGPAQARFLEHAERRQRRREISIGLFRTAGSIGPSGYPAGAAIGRPSNTEYA
ncbi:MAG: DUF4147 domain-containing protein, partial [Thermoplasmata archaeon]